MSIVLPLDGSLIQVFFTIIYYEYLSTFAFNLQIILSLSIFKKYFSFQSSKYMRKVQRSYVKG